MSGLIGKKIGMTNIFAEDGKILPCTVVQAGPCTVTQVRTKNHDGYDALQLDLMKSLKRAQINLKGTLQKIRYYANEETC